MEKKEEKKVCCICGKEYEGTDTIRSGERRRLLLPIVQLQCGGSGTVGTTQGFSTW